MSKTRAREGGASVFTALFSSFRISAPPSARAKKQKRRSPLQRRADNQQAKRKGIGGKEVLPACAFRAEGAVGVGAFPPFRQKRNIKTEKFSFP